MDFPKLISISLQPFRHSLDSLVSRVVPHKPLDNQKLPKILRDDAGILRHETERQVLGLTNEVESAQLQRKVL
jgi:hypothetical protein